MTLSKTNPWALVRWRLLVHSLAPVLLSLRESPSPDSLPNVNFLVKILKKKNPKSLVIDLRDDKGSVEDAFSWKMVILGVSSNLNSHDFSVLTRVSFSFHGSTAAASPTWSWGKHQWRLQSRWENVSPLVRSREGGLSRCAAEFFCLNSLLCGASPRAKTHYSRGRDRHHQMCRTPRRGSGENKYPELEFWT